MHMAICVTVYEKPATRGYSYAAALLDSFVFCEAGAYTCTVLCTYLEPDHQSPSYVGLCTPLCKVPPDWLLISRPFWLSFYRLFVCLFVYWFVLLLQTELLQL